MSRFYTLRLGELNIWFFSSSSILFASNDDKKSSTNVDNSLISRTVRSSFDNNPAGHCDIVSAEPTVVAQVSRIFHLDSLLARSWIVCIAFASISTSLDSCFVVSIRLRMLVDIVTICEACLLYTS